MTTAEYNRRLLTLQGLSEADLQANRRGTLSKEQRVRLQYTFRKQALLLLLALVMVPYIAWPLVQILSSTPLAPLPSTRLVGTRALLFYFVVIIPLVELRLRERLKVVEGVFPDTLTPRAARARMTFRPFVHRYARQFRLHPPSLRSALTKGTRYRFFLVRDVVVGVEALSEPTSAIAFERLATQQTSYSFKPVHFFTAIVSVIAFVLPIAVMVMFFASK